MTIENFHRINDKKINKLIASALNEDKVHHDITSNLLKRDILQKKINAELLCKEDCVLAGVKIFKKVINQIDSNIKIYCYAKDGMHIKKNNIVLRLYGSPLSLLKGERTALNFIQRMSGIATLTNKFVKKLKYKNSFILHTRKTTPNFRLFEMLAVKIGGGEFYRENLASSVMIKDNHIIAAGTISDILKILINTKRKSFSIIEIKSISELNELLNNDYSRINRIMLDNFSDEDIKQAIKLLSNTGIEIEISGGLNLENFMKKQKKGIKYYSIGALTHSYKSMDFSLEFKTSQKDKY